MSKERNFIDVLIIESNMVYREVPFQVVSDWVQQGRLLENDKLRSSGKGEWLTVGSSPDFSPYLPRSEPDRIDDTAEALEPVELDIRWKHAPPDEDDDVDMIPLIDVSLVLLIFFMLTASTSAGLSAFVPTPPAKSGTIDPNKEGVHLNINLEGDRPVYSISVGGQFLDRENDSNLQTMDEMLARLQEYLKDKPERVEVSINAHPDVKAGLTRDLMARLENEPFRSRILKKYFGVSDYSGSE